MVLGWFPGQLGPLNSSSWWGYFSEQVFRDVQLSRSSDSDNDCSSDNYSSLNFVSSWIGFNFVGELHIFNGLSASWLSISSLVYDKYDTFFIVSKQTGLESASTIWFLQLTTKCREEWALIGLVINLFPSFLPTLIDLLFSKLIICLELLGSSRLILSLIWKLLL